MSKVVNVRFMSMMAIALVWFAISVSRTAAQERPQSKTAAGINRGSSTKQIPTLGQGSLRRFGATAPEATQASGSMSICTAVLEWQFDGAVAGDALGYRVSGAGDVNNDGFEDVIVGALNADPGGRTGAGSAYVYSGQSGALLWQFDGAVAGDLLGRSVSGAGDVNNDGFDDVIVGADLADPGGRSAAGSAYVYSGQTGALLWQFDGAVAGDFLGISVSGAGDVNNDGFDDVIVGANGADPGGQSSAGSVYVYSGQTGALLWQFDGAAASDSFGSTVSGAGDGNNDGFDDVIVGALNADPAGLGNAGSAYVYSGQTGTLLWQFDGAVANDILGFSVSGAGDVNNDGFDDVIVGARQADPGGRIDAGSAYVYSGQTGALLWQFDGAAADDRLGSSVSGAGDVNNDGFDDMIVGAYAADPGGPSFAGSAYVYSGQTGALLWQFDGAVASDFLGFSVSGAGDVNNDGFDDVIVGANGADPGGRSSAGSVYVFVSDFSTWYVDADGDGFGNPSVTLTDCTQPAGYVADNTDCDDGNASVHPGANELCNGTDDDCDGTIDDNPVNPTTWYRDVDGDGFGTPTTTLTQCTQPAGYVADNTDCNDGNASIHPGATEVCNGTDDDCDGTIDNGALDAPTWYADADGDGFGTPATTLVQCTQPVAYVSNSTDCNDTDPDINPGATEVCNGTDDDCDGTIDNGAVDAPTWYADADGDGFGTPTTTLVQCDQPVGYVSNSTDCNDTDPDVNPGATEVCNGTDDDCDGTIDNGAVDAPTWYADADADGFGTPATTLVQCTQPVGYVSNSTDCDDSDPDVNPGATEVCNGTDDDCDGTIDNGAVDAPTWYADADGDGFGTPATTLAQCDQPVGYVANNTDCNDSDPEVYPGATEVCNDIDDNCDGTVDEGAVCCSCPFQADFNADVFVDAVDLAFEIDAVFFGGSDPQDPGCPTTRGDFNNDGVTDAVDLAFLIDHVFFGQPGPCDPCNPVQSTCAN